MRTLSEQNICANRRFCFVFTLIISGLMIWNTLNANPTTAGTIISSNTIEVFADDQVIATGNPVVMLTVAAIHGIEIIPTLQRTVSGNGLNPIFFPHTIINKANTADALAITLSNTNGWTAEIVSTDQTTTLSLPLVVEAQSSLDFVVKFTPNQILGNTGVLAVSLNVIPYGTYTGFNGLTYGGSGYEQVTDNIEQQFLDNIGPSILAIDPTPDAAEFLPYQDLVIDIDDLSSSVNGGSISVMVNDEQAIVSGSFTAGFSGMNSRFIPSANGFRVVVDKVSLLPQSATILVTVSAADTAGNPAISTYSFTTTTCETIRLQLGVLLQGYYDPSADITVTTQVSVEFRTTRNVAAASFNLQVGPTGWSDILELGEVLAGDYFVYVKHLNHIPVVTTQSIGFGNLITTVNISDTTSPYYQAIYLSGLANVTANLRTEVNGKLTVRGGDYNNDGVINIVDWSAFDYEWINGGTRADYDGNGIIDTRDYGIWLSNNQIYLPCN